MSMYFRRLRIQGILDTEITIVNSDSVDLHHK